MSQNDCMWLEIHIPQSLRMPFDERVIAKHMNHLTDVAEANPDEEGQSHQ